MSSITQILELSVFAKGHKQNKNQNSTSSWIKKKNIRHKWQIKVILPLYLSLRQTSFLLSVKLQHKFSSVTFLMILQSYIYERRAVTDEQPGGHWYCWNTCLVMNVTSIYPVSPDSIISHLESIAPIQVEQQKHQTARNTI